MAETINGLYKAELIRRRDRWASVGEVEQATAAWVAWWNNRRLHGTCGRMTPVEFEAAFYAPEGATAAA